MEFIKENYLKVMEHSKSTNRTKELSNLKAYKIDDADGIAEALGFKSNMLSRVDYFVNNFCDVQLIEFSDLERTGKVCQDKLNGLINDYKIKNPDKKLSKKAQKDFCKQAWESLTHEFTLKWNGSIAIIERLYRKTNELGSNDPKYQLLIVCKNESDPRELDDIKTLLQGTMHIVLICITNKLSDYIISS